MAFILGLTGGIGAGKSTASQFFQAVGLPIVDADAISRRLTAAGGDAMPAVRETFGDAFVTETGAMDRHAMREHVFAEPDALKTLETLLAPYLKAGIQEALNEAAQRSSLVIFDCPLLLETPSWAAWCDATLYISADKAIRTERVLARPGLTPDTVERIMAKQIAPQAALKKVDYVVVNNTTEDDLKAGLVRLLTHLPEGICPRSVIESLDQN